MTMAEEMCLCMCVCASFKLYYNVHLLLCITEKDNAKIQDYVIARK